jgi:hypothetical protein
MAHLKEIIFLHMHQTQRAEVLQSWPLEAAYQGEKTTSATPPEAKTTSGTSGTT